MREFTTAYDVPLLGSFDAEARFARVPPTYTCKGMFFAQLVTMLGGEWPEVQRRLHGAPRFGKYVPFADYPQVDYAIIAHHVAGRKFPNLPLMEGSRRVARLDFGTFAKSTVGSVMLSVVGDATSALMRFPDMIRTVMKGGSVRVDRLDGDGVRIEFTDFYGWMDCYFIGIVEGVVSHYGPRPSVRVLLTAHDRGTYEVRWT